MLQQYGYEVLAFWLGVGGLIIPIVVFFSAIRQLSNPCGISDSRAFLLVFAVYLAFWFAVTPGGDKDVYGVTFSQSMQWNEVGESHDILFYALSYFLGKLFFGCWQLYFFTISLIYVSGVLFFSKSFFPKSAFPLCLSFFVSFGFVSYGVNTLRAGFALTLLLISLACFFRYKKPILAIIFAISALACHGTMFVPVSALLLGYWIRKPNLFFVGWLGCILISIVAGTHIQNFIGGYFEGSAETRISNYALGEGGGYKTGFRWDFLIYSTIGIVVPFFYKIYYRVNDKLYDMFFCAYFAANGFWVLLIRIPFSDRLAYLSWFMLPILLMTPLFRWKEIPSRGLKVAITLLGQVLFAVFMIFYQAT